MSNLLDMSILTTLKDVIGDDLNDIIDSFLELLPGQVSAIQQAIKDGDETSLRLHAHTLKGSASNVGANGLAEVSLRIETLAKQGDTQGASVHIAPLSQIAAETNTALKQFMGR